MNIRPISINNKKGALELSIGTIVILVLAMSMLILGLVLVRSIFSGAKYNVDQMNQRVEDEIGKLFTEDKRMVVYLADGKAPVKQGDSYGVVFAIKNKERDADNDFTFDYEVEYEESSCKSIKEKDAMEYIELGKTGKFKIAPGYIKNNIIRIIIPESAPLCTVRYRISVDMNGVFYESEAFDVEILAQ